VQCSDSLPFETVRHVLTVHGRRVTLLKWYGFLLFKRDKFSPILAGRSLLQEFIVDAWVVVERGRLQFIKLNQTKMKAQKYQQLVDSIKNKVPTSARRVILPSTFIGGPQAMSQLYQDLMAICKKYSAFIRQLILSGQKY
jgi:hypothetical protein